MLGRLVVLAFAVAEAGRIRNVLRDTVDNEHDAHDGTIQQWTPGGAYYRYAMSYTNCTMNSGPRSWQYKAINWGISTFAPLAASCAGFNCAPIMFHRFGTGEDCGFLQASQ